jgi:glutathione S-transferase
MLLHDAPGAPNPKRVRMFLAEKGVVTPSRNVDLMSLEHKSDNYIRINQTGLVPALVLDDGAVLTETVAICRYIEYLHPEPPLLGRDGRDAAFVEMWQRRMELQLFQPVAFAFRHSHPRLALLEQPQLPEFAAAQRPRAIAAMRDLDAVLADRPFVAGEDFTIADITAFVALELTARARIDIPGDLPHLARWRAAVGARPSASA